jgi:hypothetical protein
MPTPLRLLILAALAAATAACAGRAPPMAFEGGPTQLGLFISPAGEPFRAAPGEAYPSATWFARADADRDGRLTAAEFRADAIAFFHSLDADRDGVVDGFETAAYERSIPEMAPRVRALQAGEGMDLSLGRGGRGGGGFDGGGGGRGRARGGGGREGAALFSYFFDPEPVTAADADFSSRITLAEAQAIADRRFAMLDTSRSGHLTLAALPKTPVQAAAEARANDRRRNRPAPAVEPAPRPPGL